MLGASTLTAFAFSARGNPLQHVDLNDGGIWVTNNSDGNGYFGRVNVPAATTDDFFQSPATKAAQPGGGDLDVLQSDSAVVARDNAADMLYPVDPALGGVEGTGVSVPHTDLVSLNGGSLAVLDPSSGKLWARRIATSTAITDLSGLLASKPIAVIGKPAAAAGEALTIGLDGTVYAVSDAGKAVTLPSSGATFSPAQNAAIRPMGKPAATAVGATLLVYSEQSGALQVVGGQRFALPNDPSLRLQQPGPTSDVLLAENTRSLVSITLSTGQRTLSYSHPVGAPTAPVVVAGCAHAAWGAASAAAGAVYYRSCPGTAKAKGVRTLDAQQFVGSPMFRVNRGLVVLNDPDSGAIEDFDQQNLLSNWPQIKAEHKNQEHQKHNKQHQKQPKNSRFQPPTIVPQTVGARPGQTSVLHVLDKDTHPKGYELGIVGHLTSTKAGVHLSVSPDEQTIDATVPAAARGSFKVKYTIDDGLPKGEATGPATVNIRPQPADSGPRELPHTARTWIVAQGGDITIPVLGGWRDADGDSVALASAQVGSGDGDVTTTPDGAVDFTAPDKAGTFRIDYTVTDGQQHSTGRVDVRVQGANDRAVAPTAQPDVVSAEVGRPITVTPLDNDYPGSDPDLPNAALTLSSVSQSAALHATADPSTGIVTVHATQSGTHLLNYGVAFGSAKQSRGVIRVDVAKAPPSAAPPIAVPDTATLYGKDPATIDVLANDSDPAGDLLVVQGAAPADPSSGLEAGVVSGRWVHIDDPSGAAPTKPEIVNYTISDGESGSVTGQITVTFVAANSQQDVPVAHDDTGVVRAGDSVVIPVLDNDVDPDGYPLRLDSTDASSSVQGEFPVTWAPGSQDSGFAGTAYLDGKTVRYVAPPTVHSAESVEIRYAAADQLNSSQATVTVQLVPLPTAKHPDQAPTPQGVQARVVAGDTVTIPVPTSNVDPDGDSVSVVGLGETASGGVSAPLRGRILSTTATAITYQAFPGSAETGTDRFDYVVQDRYGATGQASVEVAVVSAGQIQAPIAITDVITAAPGARLKLDVLANDVYQRGDHITIDPLKSDNSLGVPAGVVLPAGRDFIAAVAPATSGSSLSFSYSITDGVATSKQATVTITAKTGYDIPPVAQDVYAKPLAGGTKASADVVGADYDPDSATQDITLQRFKSAAVTVNGGTVTVPLGRFPQAIPYTIRDARGASASATIHVPATNGAAPLPKRVSPIVIRSGGHKTINVADYVTVPAGKTVRLTTSDEIATAPSNVLSYQVAKGQHSLTLLARGKYTGPGSLTFQVTDGTSNVGLATITVPVEVGSPAPVLNCPSGAVDLVEGGPAVTLDVASLCHVWAADPTQIARLKFTGQLQGAGQGVSVSSPGHVLSLTASSSTQAGPSGRLLVTSGHSNKGSLAIRVVPQVPPSLVFPTIQAKRGQVSTIDIVRYMTSPFPVSGWHLVGTPAGKAGTATVTARSATSFGVTPAKAVNGDISFVVRASDVRAANPQREVSAVLTLNVQGPPAAPSDLQAIATGKPTGGETSSVTITWGPIAYGAPDSYGVFVGGSLRRTCPPANNGCTVGQLTPGHHYTFTVKAHNADGYGQASTVSATPTLKPGVVSNVTVAEVRDRALRLSWTPAPPTGQLPIHYVVTGGTASAPTSHGALVTGLSNDVRQTFTIKAVNADGPSADAVSISGESIGRPTWSAAPTVTSENSADGSLVNERLTWALQDPNGPASSIRYSAFRGKVALPGCQEIRRTSCLDPKVANDGTPYSYSVLAINTDDGTQTRATSPIAHIVAAAKPSPITNLQASPTGEDDKATLTFDAPASHGQTSTVTCTADGQPCTDSPWTLPREGQTDVPKPLSGLSNGASETITLQDCNGSDAATDCDDPATTQVTTYGAIPPPQIQTSTSGTTVNFSATVDGRGRAGATANVTSNHGFNQTFQVGVGQTSSPSYSEDVGFSSSDTITVTVTDPGRETVQNKATSGQTEPKPPPPPAATISSSEGPAGTSASSQGCTSTADGCRWLNFTVSNFTPGNYPWQCISNGSVSFSSTTSVAVGANQSFSGSDQSGHRFCIFGAGVTEQIRINGVTSTPTRF
jgi:hypothetical protein